MSKKMCLKCLCYHPRSTCVEHLKAKADFWKEMYEAVVVLNTKLSNKHLDLVDERDRLQGKLKRWKDW